jgi:predicted RNase H-like HicB family nuclease
MQRRRMTFTVVVEEEPVGHWHAYAPAVPGCFAGGRSRAEALKRFRGALKMHLTELAASGHALPVERRPAAVQLTLQA